MLATVYMMKRCYLLHLIGLIVGAIQNIVCLCFTLYGCIIFIFIFVKYISSFKYLSIASIHDSPDLSMTAKEHFSIYRWKGNFMLNKSLFGTYVGK